MKAPALLAPLVLLVALLAVAPVWSPTWAQDAAPSPQEAARLEREAEAARADAARIAAEADEQAAEIERLQHALVDAAAERGGGERAALAVEARLAALETEEAALAARIEADRESLRDVFAALARIERARPPAMLTSGSDALSAARAASLLADIAPALEARAAEALDRLDAVSVVRADIAAEQATLAQAETALAAQGAQIAALIEARTAEMSRLRADSSERSEAAQALAARAASMMELIAAIQEQSGEYEPTSGGRVAEIPTPRLRPSPDQIGARQPPPDLPPTARFADARGALSPPVAGDVVAGFGDSHAGDASEGVWFRTRRGALVTSPFDARIEFAQEYGTYGRLLLLNVGDDYHVILSGLNVLYGVEGQTVMAGEPVGEMSDAAGAAPELYVQIRKEGRAIDPAPWWAAERR